jgi:hypothetical protein
MTKKEFNELQVGDKFQCLGVVYTVAELERTMVEPGVYDLYALTTTDGSRVKKQDSIVEDFVKWLW